MAGAGDDVHVAVAELLRRAADAADEGRIERHRVEVADGLDAAFDLQRVANLCGFGLDPLYESPGRDDDELLQFPNVVMTPHIAAQPRFNALDDLEEMITGLVRACSK